MDGRTMNAQWSGSSARPHFGRVVGLLAILLGLGVAGPGAVTAAPNAGAGAVGATARDLLNIATVRGTGRVSAGAGRASGAHSGSAARGHHGGGAAHGRTAAVRGAHGGGAVHGGTAVRGSHGGGAVRGGTAVRGARGNVAVRGGAVMVRPVRPWVHRPYYGTIVGGIAIGTIIAATAAGVVPVAPSSDLCWYWTGSGHTRGYWDYCSGP